MNSNLTEILVSFSETTAYAGCIAKILESAESRIPGELWADFMQYFRANTKCAQFETEL